MGRVNYQKYAKQLLAVSHLFFGFAFTAETSTSGWALQSFVTEPDILPPVFDINKTGTTYDAYIFMDTNTNGVASGNLVATIIDDEGQLIWSAGYSETTNPSFQTYSELRPSYCSLLGEHQSLISQLQTVKMSFYTGMERLLVTLVVVTAKLWS